MCVINSRRSDKLLNAASTEAYRSQMRFRHGAVITKGGKLLAAGHNHVRTRFSGPLASNDAITLPFELGHESSSFAAQHAHHASSSSSASSSSAASASHSSSNTDSSSASSSSPAASASGSTGYNSSSDASSSLHNNNGGSSSTAHSVGQHSFSMHAEMHAISSALRGARPQRHKSHLSVDPQLAALALAASNSSSSSSAASQQQPHRHQHKSKLKTKIKHNGNSIIPPRLHPPRPRGGLNPAADLDSGKKKKNGGGSGGGVKSKKGGSANAAAYAQVPAHYQAGYAAHANGGGAAGGHSGNHHAGFGSTSFAAASHAASAPGAGNGGGFGAPSPRLRGADMYVVRLLQDAESKARARAKRRALTSGTSAANRNGSNGTTGGSGGSVHWTDEEFAGAIAGREPKYADSRPCWRCLKWMEWAGIKRVFWTDENGVWEGAKVVQLLYGPFPNPLPVSSNTSSDADSDTDTGSSSPSARIMPILFPAIHITRYEQAAIVQAARASGAAVGGSGGGTGGGGSQARKKGRG
ncbi:hypothetical protein OC842_004609 [Tilletia horrida]|uniref:CMP/dCMP-type deaminase domain-containing protein n=1 Tax=Tilletia horrida TaxID=155126 RepID=A0AAN6GBQ8_9BASI|nr:hypothetical protein OC842_004609 [Tilletia horrida]